MADHHAEQIMAAVTTLLTGLATTGANVMRDRVYDVDAGVDQALSIYIRDDDPMEDSPWPYIDSMLTLYVDIHVRTGSDTPVSKTVNQIRKEMVIAILADYKMGLSFVHEVVESIANFPATDYVEQPVVVQRTEWSIKYRRSQTDPSQW